MNEGMYSSNSAEWETPQWLYEDLDALYQFTLDPCATAENAKCKKYYTKEDDGLSKSWEGERVFMNPPYGREIKQWIEKAYYESAKCRVIALIPARTDTKYWHMFIFNVEGVDVTFLPGRLKFSNSKNSAPFPSAVIDFNRGAYYEKAGLHLVT